MSDVVEPTGQAPATPGTSSTEAPPQVQEGSLLTGQPVEAKPAEAAKPDPVIPEKYEFKAPEGIELDTELLEAIAPTFKELGLTQESASKLVDGFNAIAGKLGEAREAKAEADFKQFMADTAKANKEAVRKEWGHNYDANLAIAQRGIARFLSDAGKQKLEQSGLANDPEFVKAFYQAGKMIQEDIPPVTGVPMGTKPATLAAALYGNKH